MLHTALPDAGTDGRARATALERLSLVEVTPTAVVEFVSRGHCLVIGAEADALEFVRLIGGRLECTVAVPGEARPDVDRVEGTLVVRGGRPVVRGALGNFDIRLATAEGQLALGGMLLPPIERFDLVVDLGPVPLLQQAMKPLGYYRPGDDADSRATLAATLPDMRGEFEKPRFFNYNPEICAHGYSGRNACTRCIDFCPAEAIVSIGNKVQVNPYLCQGGGTCATVCPSGAMTYAYPVPGDLLRALRELLRDYREAGGAAPVLLFHDETSGNALGDEFAATMPGHVLPVAIEEIGATGIDVWLACLAYGAESVVLLTCDATPLQVVEALQEQVAIAQAILAGMGYAEARLRMLNADQPAATRAALATAPGAQSRPAATFAAPPADKRGTLRLALAHLQAHASAAKRVTPLPVGAPFGEIRVDAAACTLCMSCVSACPTFALQDGRGLPQLNFREWNCVQCGLCARTCPENAISLSPRLLNDAEARERPRTVHEEEPVCCLGCGKPFATRSVLDKLGKKLEGHWMFQGEEARRRLQMCEDCRVRDMFTAEQRRGR